MGRQSDLDHQPDQPASATTTVSPMRRGALVRIDPNPAHFRLTRAALRVEGVLLLALGAWGVLAAATTPTTNPSGAPVLIFHLTVGHGVLLAATGLLALLGATRRRWGFAFTAFQAVGYGLLFMASTGLHDWIAGPGDDLLHGLLAVTGLGLLMWTASRELTDWQWARRGRDDQS